MGGLTEVDNMSIKVERLLADLRHALSCGAAHAGVCYHADTSSRDRMAKNTGASDDHVGYSHENYL